MKPYLILIIGIIGISFSCKTTNKIHPNKSKITEQNKVINDTVVISSDKLEYDIIIIDIGFSTWLNTRAKPENYYSQNYLESKNLQYVTAWNIRANNPNYNQNLYEMRIDYQSGIDYGYEVNYKLYNYFLFFQNTYNQNLLGGYVPLN